MQVNNHITFLLEDNLIPDKQVFLYFGLEVSHLRKTLEMGFKGFTFLIAQ